MSVEISENTSLSSLHTFGASVVTRLYAEVNSINDLQEVLSTDIQPKLILGGGSNMLFTQNFPGMVIRNCLSGINKMEENDQTVVLRVGAGVVWQDLIEYCLDRDFGGIENLSLIPGTVGAAPIQNIGAYGVEFESVFEGLEAIEVSTQEIKTFNKEECGFSYRESIFKEDLKGRYVITYVSIRLTKSGHQMVLDYGQVARELEMRKVTNPTIRDVSNVIVDIRRSKLPDPTIIGNAGSFFKNPVISVEQYSQLKLSYPELPSYPFGQKVKIPAAWLIEYCGWKGYRSGDVGIYPKHALVLVNYGGATGGELTSLAEALMRSVKDTFAIELTPEVNVI